MNTEIILIDDDPVSILLSKFLLEKSFDSRETITLTSFTRPKEGLNHIEDLLNNKIAGNCLKILLDINMPLISGWEFLDLLNEYDPEKKIRVIMHSSSIRQADISKALANSRVDCYICKPMENEKVMRIINYFVKSIPMKNTNKFASN
ncbi:MAG: response regulator [Flavobacterium sp.]|nr:response regulator [Flavobacterium sp.]